MAPKLFASDHALDHHVARATATFANLGSGVEMSQHARSRSMPASRSTSAILTARGSAPPMRTPTVCCASTSPRGLISASSALTRSPPSRRSQARPRKSLHGNPAEALDALLQSATQPMRDRLNPSQRLRRCVFCACRKRCTPRIAASFVSGRSTRPSPSSSETASPRDTRSGQVLHSAVSSDS